MHGIAVVRQDRDQQRLADVVHVAIDGGHNDAAFAIPGLFFEVLLEVVDRFFHHLGALQHERQDQFARAEAVANVLHRGQQNIVEHGDCGGRPNW